MAALHAELKMPKRIAESDSQHTAGLTFHVVANVGHAIQGLMEVGIVTTTRLPMQNHTNHRT